MSLTGSHSAALITLNVMVISVVVMVAVVLAQNTTNPREQRYTLVETSSKPDHSGSYFGVLSADKSGKSIAVGAPFTTAEDKVDTGALYLSVCDESCEEELVLQGQHHSEHFGTTVQLAPMGRVLVVGSPDKTRDTMREGAVSIYHRRIMGDKAWYLVDELYHPQNAWPDECYGTFMGLSDDGKSLVVAGKVRPQILWYQLQASQGSYGLVRDLTINEKNSTIQALTMNAAGDRVFVATETQLYIFTQGVGPPFILPIPDIQEIQLDQDGYTIVLGCPLAADHSGKVFICRQNRDQQTYRISYEIPLPPKVKPGSRFGYITISYRHGLWLGVGAPGINSVYCYYRPTQDHGFDLNQVLECPSKESLWAEFGRYIHLNEFGTQLIVSAAGDQRQSGSIWRYSLS